MGRILDNIHVYIGVRISNRLCTSINPGSSEGDGDGDGNDPKNRMKKTTNFAAPARFSLQTVRTGRKHGDKFNFFAKAELECAPQDSGGKFTYICHFKRVDGNKLVKVKNKNKNKTKQKTLILIAG